MLGELIPVKLMKLYQIGGKFNKSKHGFAGVPLCALGNPTFHRIIGLRAILSENLRFDSF